MDTTEIVQRLTAVEAKADQNETRIEKLEPIVDSIHNMTVSLVKMSDKLDNIDKSVSKMDKKVEELEKVPAQKWKASTTSLSNAIISTIGAALGAGIIWLIIQSV